MIHHMDIKKNTAWLQISAGQGPKECGWVVAQLYKAISIEALKNGITQDCIEVTAFEKQLRKQDIITPDAYRSVLLRLEGRGSQTLAQQWAGTIKWQGQSPYRPKHKRINWFAGIETVTIGSSKVKPIAEIIKEVDIQVTKARGPGGQHVNKTSSAVRIAHKPSGIKIRVELDRSQHRNKKLALEKLQLMLAQGSDDQTHKEIRERWLNHYQVKRGDPVKIFSGPSFTQVKE